MRKLLLAITAILSLSAFYITDSNIKVFKKMYAFEGIWKMNARHVVICEEWKKISKTHLQSRGYIIKNGDTVINERVALTKTNEGIFYTSTVEGQNNKQPIAFKMTKAENNMFVFENPQHDFPKRIVYKLVTADSLYAYVDDGNDKSNKRQHFYYKKQ